MLFGFFVFDGFEALFDFQFSQCIFRNDLFSVGRFFLQGRDSSVIDGFLLFVYFFFCGHIFFRFAHAFTAFFEACDHGGVVILVVGNRAFKIVYNRLGALEKLGPGRLQERRHDQVDRVFLMREQFVELDFIAAHEDGPIGEQRRHAQDRADFGARLVNATPLNCFFIAVLITDRFASATKLFAGKAALNDERYAAMLGFNLHVCVPFFIAWIAVGVGVAAFGPKQCFGNGFA